ncbi:DUF4249 domain-containing protein [Puia sp.]|jgi:hypothetical protein|uniref:DUF4249 domain-containing protein n=1 Tax=Puia sp. TaxID=2045100 RepID=UPI002F3F3D2B
MNHYKTLFLILLIASLGCRQTYQPPAIANPPDYLVVEGFINTNAGDTTFFNLSHTVKLDTNAYHPESGAMVTVEGNDNSSFPLREITPGIYGSQLPALNYSVPYRLHIVTAAGKQYASDYVQLVANPPIDSISWKRLDNDVHQGIQIYANTHDPQNKTHYYRWDYSETWEFHSPYFATVKYVPGTGLVGYSPNTITTCWHSDRATGIFLGTSTQLSQDLIYEAPLVLIPIGSQQITVRYSILVTQYALTQEAFNWWQILQKNTEQIGSIFGVQPSANKGNIRCLTDTAETVLGFVSGGNIQSQRIFITNDQVFPWYYDPDCLDQKVTNNIDSLKYWFSIGYLPWSLDLSPPNKAHFAYKTCVDCTLTGTNVKPSFW